MDYTRDQDWKLHIVAACDGPPFSDLDGFSDFSGEWVGIFVELLGALPANDAVLLGNVICYNWFMVLSDGFFSICSSEFTRGYAIGVLLVFFEAYTELATGLANI